VNSGPILSDYSRRRISSSFHATSSLQVAAFGTDAAMVTLNGKMGSVCRAAISTDYTDYTDFTERIGL
jgi:hypothetical protein